MIGSLDRSQREVTVIGAGISGLLAAYQLDRAGYQVTVLETGDRAGGLICTTRTEHGIAESAAHSLLGTSAVCELCTELGVELLEVRRDSRARYVWRGGKPRRLPLGPFESLSALGRFAISARAVAESESLEEWARRRLGTAGLDYLMSPFLLGIYAARPGEISARAFFESMRRSKGPRPSMAAPRDGMQALTDALEARLRARLGSRFRLGEAARGLPAASNVLVCTPARAAGALLEAADEGLAEALTRVRYAPLVSVTLFASTQGFRTEPRGVGVLVPEREGRACLGILFNSSAFEGRARGQGIASFTMMLGGTLHPSIVDEPDERIREIALGELRAILGFVGEIAEHRIHRWPSAIPIYSADLEALWARARGGWCATPGRILFGNYTGQVSLRGMIESARALS